MTRSLALISLTAFLLMLGLSVLFPILPYFADALGLSEFQSGVLMSSYAIASVIMAPFWGRYSERRGRKPAIVIGLLGFAAAFALFGIGNSFWWLLSVRSIGGLFAAAALPSLFSYVADVSAPERRSVALGVVGAALGLGTVLGPAIGGVLGDPELFGPQSLRLPFFVAAVIGAASALLVVLILPESLTSEIRANSERRRAELSDAGLSLGSIARGLAPFLTYSVLVQTGRTGLESTFGWLVLQRFGGDTSSTGVLLFALGVTAILIQGGAMRSLAKRYADSSMLVVGTLLLAVGIACVGLAPTWSLLVVATVVVGLGLGVQLPTFTAELSRAAEGLQGEAQGLNASAQSIGRALGPMMFTAIYQFAGAELAFGLAGLLCAVGLTLALGGLRSHLPAAGPAGS